MEAEVPFLVKYCCIKKDCQLVHWHIGETTKAYLSALLLDVTLLWNKRMVTPWLLENISSITLLSQSVLKISAYRVISAASSMRLIAAPWFITHSNPVQNAWIITDSVNLVFTYIFF